MTAIQLQNLTKRYNETLAVDTIDLTIERGEVFGFIGPNGAGKSTTIGMILDLIRPTDGSISVLGYDAQTEQRTIRKCVGILPQQTGLFPRLTGIEHLRYAIDAHEDPNDSAAFLERVGLLDAGNDPVSTYSTGMQQRLRLAIALVGEPDVLILDEPASGLDPGGIQRLSDIVTTERDRGTSVFFSSHGLDRVRSICDRVGVLVDGELAAVEAIQDSTEPTTSLRIVVDTNVDAVVAALKAHESVVSLTRVNGRNDRIAVRVTLGEPSEKAAVLRTAESAGRLVDFSIEDDALESLYASATEEAA